MRRNVAFFIGGYMKKVKWLFLLIVLAAAFLNAHFNLNMAANAGGGSDEITIDSGYTVNSFHSDVTVNKDGVYNIVETINVTFKSVREAGESRGIYRYIPYRVEAVREVDGKVRTNFYTTKIKNAKSLTEENMRYDGEEGYNYVFRFGSANTLVNGKTIEYVFSYDYCVPDDRYKSFDDFYFNLIGNGWTTTINNYSFKITFPESVKQEGMATYFYDGEVGGTHKASVTLADTADNVIEGTLNSSIDPGEAFTIRTVLPDGYFSEIEKGSDATKIVAIVLTSLLLVAMVAAAILGKSKAPIMPVVNFDPPEGMSPLKMKAYISARGIKAKDLAPMIIYWANAGYLKITERSDRKFSLQKVKDLDKYEYEQEKKMFDDVIKIYEDGVINSSDTKARTALGEHMAAENTVLKTSVGTRHTTGSTWMALFVVFAMLLSMAFINYVFGKTVGDKWIFSIRLTLTILGGLPLFLLSFRYIKSELWGVSKGKVVLLCFAFFGATFLFTNSTFASLRDSTILYGATKYLVALLVPVMCLAIGSVLQEPEPLKKKLGEIYGYANNLLLVESDRLKAMLKDDPTIFYKVLPYTYILGINKKFTKKFEGIAIASPDWLDSPNTFDLFVVSHLGNRLNSDFSRMGIADAIQKGISKASSVGGGRGGGFSGGGFSGGGFGGGGGGRW